MKNLEKIKGKLQEKIVFEQEINTLFDEAQKEESFQTDLISFLEDDVTVKNALEHDRYQFLPLFIGKLLDEQCKQFLLDKVLTSHPVMLSYILHSIAERKVVFDVKEVTSLWEIMLSSQYFEDEKKKWIEKYLRQPSINIGKEIVQIKGQEDSQFYNVLNYLIKKHLIPEDNKFPENLIAKILKKLLCSNVQAVSIANCIYSLCSPLSLEEKNDFFEKIFREVVGNLLDIRKIEIPINGNKTVIISDISIALEHLVWIVSKISKQLDDEKLAEKSAEIFLAKAHSSLNPANAIFQVIKIFTPSLQYKFLFKYSRLGNEETLYPRLDLIEEGAYPELVPWLKENIEHVAVLQKNPFFVLSYAMACKDIDLFQKALSLATQKVLQQQSAHFLIHQQVENWKSVLSSTFPSKTFLCQPSHFDEMRKVSGVFMQLLKYCDLSKLDNTHPIVQHCKILEFHLQTLIDNLASTEDKIMAKDIFGELQKKLLTSRQPKGILDLFCCCFPSLKGKQSENSELRPLMTANDDDKKYLNKLN